MVNYILSSRCLTIRALRGLSEGGEPVVGGLRRTGYGGDLGAGWAGGSLYALLPKAAVTTVAAHV